MLEVQLEVSIEMVTFPAEQQESISKAVFHRELFCFKLFCSCQEAIHVLAKTHLQGSSDPGSDIRSEH